jgi:ribosomal protein S18 acetylase RimI-like enzyme
VTKATPRSSAVKLRPGRVSDLDALLALERRAFTADRLSRRSLRHFLASPRASLLVAETAGKLAGCALVLYRRRSKLARLYSIAIAPEFRRRGLARSLLGAAEEQAMQRGGRAMRIEVREDNARAISLYQRSGYRPFDRHRGYYDDGCDALRFEKTLGAETRGRRRVTPR